MSAERANEILKGFQRLEACRSWTDVLAMTQTVEARVAIYAIIAAALVHDRGGCCTITNETLVTLIRRAKIAKWTPSFQVHLNAKGIEVTL